MCNTYPDVSIKNMEIEILKKNCEVFDRKYWTICTNNQEEVQIQECEELYRDLEFFQL